MNGIGSNRKPHFAIGPRNVFNSYQTSLSRRAGGRLGTRLTFSLIQNSQLSDVCMTGAHILWLHCVSGIGKVYTCTCAQSHRNQQVHCISTNSLLEIECTRSSAITWLYVYTLHICTRWSGISIHTQQTWHVEVYTHWRMHSTHSVPTGCVYYSDLQPAREAKNTQIYCMNQWACIHKLYMWCTCDVHVCVHWESTWWQGLFLTRTTLTMWMNMNVYM